MLQLCCILCASLVMGATSAAAQKHVCRPRYVCACAISTSCGAAAYVMLQRCSRHCNFQADQGVSVHGKAATIRRARCLLCYTSVAAQPHAVPRPQCTASQSIWPIQRALCNHCRHKSLTHSPSGRSCMRTMIRSGPPFPQHRRAMLKTSCNVCPAAT